jgi:hypothetical protein
MLGLQLAALLGFVLTASLAYAEPSNPNGMATDRSAASAASADPDLTVAVEDLVRALQRQAVPASSASAHQLAQAAKPEQAPTVASIPVAVPPPLPMWPVAKDAQLQAVLSDWCRRAGWTLVWHSEYSYRLDAAANFDGDFVAAVTALFNGMRTVVPPIYPEIYRGNRVLVVKNTPSN